MKVGRRFTTLWTSKASN